MKKNLQSEFQTRQYMLSKDFEIYYYHDLNLSKVDLHTHNYYEFYFLLEGDVSMQIKDNVYSLKFGDMVVIPPKTLHRLVIHDQTVSYRRFVFWISKDYCNNLINTSNDYGYLMQYVQVNDTYVFHNDQISFNTVQSMILRLLEETYSHRFGRDAQICLCVNELILYLNRMIHERHYPKSKATDNSLYRNIITYIEENVEDNLSLDHLAETFFVSKYHIAHVFKENVGLSIHRYITKKRLILCREALLGDMNITEIYQTFGFKDYSSFYRAFKKEYGISPKDFRDMRIMLRS